MYRGSSVRPFGEGFLNREDLVVGPVDDSLGGDSLSQAAAVPFDPVQATQTGTGSISLTGAGTASTQNFDTLANTGTSGTLPTGWFFNESGTAENAVYSAGTGSATGGDTYSFGAAASTDRALGTLQSGSNVPSIGAQFTNNTGGSIGSLAIAYTGEQWRLGAAGRADRLDFQISFDATSLTTGTWTDVNELDFTAPVTAGTVGALDGNAVANQTAKSFTLVLANAIASGATFWIRWTDFNATGSDDGLAIDNFSLTPIAASTTPSLTINDVAVAEGDAGTTVFTFTVSLSAPAPAGGVTFDIATADGTATAGSDYVAKALTGQTIPAGQSSYTFTVVVNGDTAAEPDEAFFVNITNVTGATVADGQGQGTITNDDGTVIPAGSFATAYTVTAPGTYILLDGTTRTQTAAGGVSVTSTTGPVNVAINGSLIDNASGQRAINFGNQAIAESLTVGPNGVVQSLNGDTVRGQSVNGTLNVTNLGQILMTATTFTPNGSGATPGNNNPGAAFALQMNAALGAVGAGASDYTSGGTITNGSSTVTTALIRSDNGDAVRVGSHTTLVNYGTINGNGQINDSPDNNAFATNGQTSVATPYDISRGVRVNQGGATAVQIDNYGTITGSQHGVDVGVVDATNLIFTNRAGASIIGRNGSGIGSDTTGTAAATVTVNNYGTISGDYAPRYDRAGYVTIDGDGDGIDVDGAATINNFAGGIIRSTGAGGFDKNGRTNNSEGLTLGGGIVVNAGTITGARYGIVVNNDSNADGSRSGVAAASITNQAGGSITGTGGFAIRLENKAGTAIDNDTILNYGTITGNGTVPTATVNLQNGSADTFTVGTLDGTTYTAADAGSARFIAGDGAAIQTGEGNDTLANYGTITGNSGRAINLEGGSDALTLYTGSTVSGRIDGGAGTDTLTLRLDDRVSGNVATGNNSGATTGTLANVVNFEALSVASGTWTLNGTQSYLSGTTIATGAQAIVTGSLSGAVTDNGTLRFNLTGDLNFTDVIGGSGSLTLGTNFVLTLGNGGNSYSGGTTLLAGTLDVTTAGAAGSGTINFTAGAETLRIGSAALGGDGAFGNAIRGFGSDGDVIDVRGVGVGTTTSYDGTTGILTLSGGGIATPVTLNIGTGYGRYVFAVASDGNGGTQVTATLPPANVYINEIHYDNAGTDAGEAIEIAGTAGTDLSGYRLVFYNGSNTPNAAPVYMTTNLTGVIDNEGGSGYGALSFSYPSNGIQNGIADGVALIAPDGTVIQLLSWEGTFTAAAGTPAAGVTSTDIGVVEDGSGALGQSLQLTGSGASYADFTWQPDSTSSFGSLNTNQIIIGDNATGLIRVADASVVEGNAGTSNLTFTIYRAGGLGSSATVNYTIALDGTATSDDIGAGAVLTGTVTFAIGANSATVTVPVVGDTVGEANETLSLTLGSTTGNVAITDGSAIGTIVNDDFVDLSIGQIQGAGHRSLYVGQPVRTTGIVTAVDTNGFYIQSAVGDGNAATSDAIFVFTGTAPTVVVGNGVTVGGTVTEFAGSAQGLTVTELTSPTVTVDTVSNPLPAAILIGTGGILPPTQYLDNDHLTVFDPANDGLDFWESLEGMRVTIDAPQVVSNTTNLGETFVIASHGVGATGVNDRGGITISPNSDGTVDYNPEIIQIDDDSGIFAGFNPNYSVGDQLSSVTGIVNYAFDNYEVLVTQAVTVTNDVTLGRETTTLQGNSDYLSLATYNLENLDPSDNKYDILASDIVYRLRAPDILAVQEVQDADGAGTGTNLSGVSNAQGIIDAIFTLTGKHYGYIEIAPTVANTTGGEPNGNIRNGYFYNMDRVSYAAGSAELITGPAYNGSRNPLVATWLFNGQSITTINVHSTSRGGSEPLRGADQPADAAGDAQRTAQAAGVKAYVNDHLATNPNLNIAVLGDWNGFYFEQAQTQLTVPAQGGMLTNVNYLLSPEERYSYLFDGNAQQIDNILVSSNLLGIATNYDAVHLNSQLGGNRPTDHDPQLVLFRFGNSGGDSFFGTNGDDTYTIDDARDRVYENADGGTDTILSSVTYSLVDAPNVENLTLTGTANINGTGNAGNNVITGNAGDNILDGNGGTDTLRGGAGNDFYIVDSADDVVIENPGEGNDVVQASVSYSIAGSVNVEALILTGSGNINATGNSNANKIIGNSGDNVLDGGGGGDVLRGGLGNDTYIVRDANDRITEANTDNNDTVQAAVSYTLSADVYIENLRTIDAAATTAINLTGNAHTLLIQGNAGANVLTGGAGGEILDGNGGTDTLRGGAGNDIYIVDSADDVVIENPGEGNDVVQASVSYSIAGSVNVEALFLTGSGNINATGNSNANKIIGNSGDNVLDGGGGGDVLRGGLGNDTYIVRDANDRITEANTDANDTVQAAVSYTLSADVYIETLRTIDAAATTAINLTGNAHTLLIQGNAGANVLTGGAGSETLFGGGGSDIFAFTVGTGQDSVADFVSGTDKLDLSAFFSDFSQVQAATQDVGGNAVIALGGGNSVTLTGVLEAQLQSGDVILGGGGAAAAPSHEAFAAAEISTGPNEAYDPSWFGHVPAATQGGILEIMMTTLP